MQHVEAATRDRRRGQRVSIHKWTAMGEVVSKSTRRDQMRRQPMNGKTIRGTGKMT